MAALRKRVRKGLRVLGILCLAGLFLLVAVAVFIQTPPGQWALAAVASSILSQATGQTWAIEGLHGMVPLNVSVDRIVWADKDGDLLILEDLRADFEARSYFGGVIHFSELSAKRLSVQRLPRNNKKDRKEGGLNPDGLARLPETLQDFRVDNAAVARLELAETAFGAAAAFSLEGAWRAPSPAGGTQSFLVVEGLDGTNAHADVRIDTGADDEDVTIVMQAEDRTFLPAQLPWPRTERVAVSIERRDTVKRRGAVQVFLNDAALLEGELGLWTREMPRVEWDGTVRLDHPVLPPAYAKACGQRPELSLDIHWPEAGRVALETLQISSDALSTTVSGSFEIEERSLQAHVKGTYSDLTRVMKVPEGVHGGPWTVDFDAGGALSELKGTLHVSSESSTIVTGEWSGALSPQLAARVALEIEPDPRVLPSEMQELGVINASIEVIQDEDGALRVPPGSVKAKGVNVEFSGAFDSKAESAEANSTLAVTDLGAFGTLLPAGLDGDVSIRAQIQASAKTLRATADVTSQELQVAPNVRVSETKVQLEATGSSWWSESERNYEFTSNGSASVDVQRAYGREITYALDGAMPSPAELRLRAFELSDGNATLSGNGIYNLETGKGDGEARLSIAELSELPRQFSQGLEGTLEIMADLNASSGEQAAGIQLEVTGLSGLPPRIASALDKEVSGQATITKAGDVINWDLAGLGSGPFSVKGNGAYLLSEEEVSAEGRFVYADASQLSQLAGTPLDGTLAGTVRLSLKEGMADARLEAGTENLVVAEWSPESVDLSATATGPLQRPEGVVSLDIRANGETLASRAEWSYTSQVVGLEEASARLDENIASLEVQYDMASRSGTGGLNASLPAIAALGRFAGLALEGAVTISADFEGSPDSMNATATAVAESLRTPWVGASSLNVSGDMRGDWLSPEGQLQLALADARIGRTTLASAEVGVAGDGNSLTLDGSIKGDVEAVGGIMADISARLEERATRLGVQRLEGQIEDYAFSLIDSAQIRREESAWSVSGFALEIGDSQVALDGTYGPENVDVKASWERLPLDLARLAGAPGMVGKTDGTLSLSGTSAAPLVRLNGRFDDVRFGSDARDHVPTADIAFDARIEEGFGYLESTGNAGELLQAEARARLPLLFAVCPFKLAFPREEALEGSLSVQGDLRVAKIAAPLDRQLIEGPVEARFEASGTLDEPRLSGEAQINGARYENLDTTTVLEDIQAVLKAEGTKLELTTFTANTAPEGTMRLAGQWDLTEESGAPFNAEAVFEEARMVNRDDLAADVSGNVAVAGDVEGMRVKGDVTIGPAVFRIPERLPTQVTTIPVEERNTPPRLKETEKAASSPFPVGLDVECKVPGRFYVLGNGLDSEWEGDLAIKGTMQKPELRGTLRVRRGLFTFLNRRLELKDSTIAFDGSTPISPYFNLWGTTDSRDLTARVHIYGNLNSVELDLESEPPLPEDQVLARLLFNRDLNQLSPVQALQLARTAAALSGGGFALSGLPQGKALPFVDRVQLQTGEEASETALGFGKYLGERTYVEVQQGIGAESGKVSVELELTPEVSVEGEVGAGAQSSVGLFWKRDY